jgi:putative flippase GtrA
MCIVSVSSYRRTWGEVIRFAIVGAIGAAIYFLTVFVLQFSNLVDSTAASVISHFFVLVITYLGNHSFTFELAGGHIGYLRKFIACGLLSLGFNWAIFKFMIEYAGFSANYGFVVVAITIPIVNFLLYKLWAFNPKTQNK